MHEVARRVLLPSMQHQRYLIALTLSALCITSGCTHSLSWVGPLHEEHVDARDGLFEAIERYYRADDVSELRSAVDEALRLAPRSGMAHEIAADLAHMDGDIDAQVTHLIAALADTRSDALDLYLAKLDGLQLSADERHRALARAIQLMKGHPSPALQSAAAASAVNLLSHAGDYAAMDPIVADALKPLDVALIGTWDNDQGKGFQTARPPESEVDLTATYPGSVVDIGWRLDAPRSRHGDYGMDALFSPSSWATAYATAVVHAERAERYELRLTSSSPFKVWLNGALVASVEERRSIAVFDAYVLPLNLRQGDNRLLIKLAHRKGSWIFRPRLTGVDGAPALGLQLRAPDTAVSITASPPERVWGPEDFIAARVSLLQGPQARRDHLKAAWSERMGLQTKAIQYAEANLTGNEDGIVGSYMLAGLYWDHQERGQAADSLGALDRRVGDALPFIRAQQARFWIQQGRKDQARDHLMALKEAHPARAAIWMQLADYFKAEDWHAERCEALEEANRLRPRWPHGLTTLGHCQSALEGPELAEQTYLDALELARGNHTTLRRLRNLYLETKRFTRAKRIMARMIAGWPASYGARVRDGDNWRRLGDRAKARERYLEAIEIDPDASWAHKRLGSLAQAGSDIDGAVMHWKEALKRNPDNDRLARHLHFHASEPDEPWVDEIPSTEAIEEAIAKGRTASHPAGADNVALIDHRVMQLFKDGSRSGVVTQVILALNEQGRDRITSMQLTERGRIQVLKAYATKGNGERVEATRPRDGKVRFRALEEGSVVVLQYRFDSGPQAYLALHMAELWSFHALGWATTWSEWSLWLDADEVVHEHGLGNYERTETQHGALKRVTWRMNEVPPLITEPGAPSLIELLNHVMVSTVPDWETFMRWEAALLAGAFRADPKLKALSASLVSPDDTPQTKVLKLHDYVMNQIRYEQDYENTIAGVKPHAAPVVSERRYGDCKDKAVLFITLARLVGVEAHFAILKTRPRGPVYRQVPYQQFDHAIVYVPAQEGIAEGRFYDPTADALDLDVLRADNAGTLALVYDPVNERHTWIPIPFQGPEAHKAAFDLNFDLTKTGSAKGTLILRGQGSMGSRLRRGARNSAKLEKWIQGLVGVLAPGATVETIDAVEVKDLQQEAVIKASFTVPEMARFSGKEARVELPWTRLYRVSPSYKLPKRRFDLIRGVPEQVDFNVTYTFPKRTKVIEAPESERIETACTQVIRKTQTSRGKVHIATHTQRTCERVTPSNYEEQRRAAKQIDDLNAHPLVLRF